LSREDLLVKTSTPLQSRRAKYSGLLRRSKHFLGLKAQNA
jgi:hypothetical protein